jgi:NADH-quinone oxidoreductase subunit M
MDHWLTTILIFLPVAGALVVAALPLSRYWAGSIASLISLIEVGLWIISATRFQFGSSLLQLDQRRSWVSDLNISYHVGQYAFSVWLVGVTTVVMAACVTYGWWVGRDRARAYFALMLLLTGAVVGVFTAQDLLLFYAFFEAMLIPLYVLIGVWGGADRLRATLTFVIYTVVGSLLMLASIVAYGLQQGTFDLTQMGPSNSTWLFLGFVVAFAIKSPLFPFHGWLPSTYRESPPEVSAVLSGIVSKAGLYGLLRIAIPKFPGVVDDWRVVLLVLASISLVYGSLLAWRAPDFRGVVMYSSLAQSGLIVLGLLANNDLGVDGAVLQMVNHALMSSTLFLLAGMVERRTSTGEFALLGGMARGRPALATVMMTAGIISLAVPLSTSFAGEFLILAGAFQQHWAWAVIGAGAIVLAAMYMLRAISAVLHQEVGPAVPESALDLREGELAVVVPLVLCLIALSAYPNLISGHAFGENRAFVGFTQATNTLGPGTCAGSTTDGSCQTKIVKSTSASGRALNVDPAASTLEMVAK